jgi:K+-transporting ATPase ATPase C chain
MRDHFRANLWLVGLTLLLCSVLYPLVLLSIGQTVFRHKAQGSLLTEDGNVTGSELIGQPFTGDEYFQPRPSSPSWNATASGASNWGANNPLLRDRVAKDLATIVRYGPDAARQGKTPGAPVAEDIVAWFQKGRFKGEKDIVAQWLERYPSLAGQWVKDTGEALKKQTGKETPGEAFAARWAQDFPDSFARWKKANPDRAMPTSGDLAKPFFEEFIRAHPGRFPLLNEAKTIVPTNEGPDIQKTFFDMWRQDNPDVDLEPVPADMVTASGSGLDPHITLDNAHYQAKYRVAKGWVERIARERKLTLSDARREQIRNDILDELNRQLEEHASAPLWGAAGVKLVNVLEVNLAVRSTMKELARTIR